MPRKAFPRIGPRSCVPALTAPFLTGAAQNLTEEKMKVEKAHPAVGMPDDLENQPEMPPEVHEPEATSVETTPSETPASVDPPAAAIPDYTSPPPPRGPISAGESAPTKIVSPW
jgi:hypothetical protein